MTKLTVSYLGVEDARGIAPPDGVQILETSVREMPCWTYCDAFTIVLGIVGGVTANALYDFLKKVLAHRAQHVEKCLYISKYERKIKFDEGTPIEVVEKLLVEQRDAKSTQQSDGANGRERGRTNSKGKRRRRAPSRSSS